MAADDSLAGVAVLVVGAGLAGLVAARDLLEMGATVTVAEARDRVGGRVWTIRHGFADGQHAEAGADLIDEEQTEIRELAQELGVKLVRVLRSGFGYARQGPNGKVRLVPQSALRGWDQLARQLAPLTRRYRWAERRWDTPVAADLARRSVAQWLAEIDADAELRTTAQGLRGFFLANAEELSLLQLVDQFSTSDQPAPGALYRAEGGNDLIVGALAARLRDRLHLSTEVLAVSQRGGVVRATLRNGRDRPQVKIDYVVFAVPATLLRRIPITPALPVQQHEAVATLRYGRGTKTLLQFDRRFWRSPARPKAFGSALAIGAGWDANEEQRGSPGILALLAGGSASDATADLTAREGISGLVRAVDWLGSGRAKLVGWQQTRWETDPWARGGYAVFDPEFPPALRGWLAQPCGNLFFAGEHTSIRWQGYMNGAVESGRRAASEVLATHRLRNLRP